MTFPPNPEDRPDPMENMPAVRARIPEHVARGEISTGVIVVTGGTEFLLDFVRNLPRPSCVVSRVVLPHLVMPQFIDALTTNIELFKQRYGELPGAPMPIVSASTPSQPTMPTEESPETVHDPDSSGQSAPIKSAPKAAHSGETQSPNSGIGGSSSTNHPMESNSIDVHAGSPPPAQPPAQNPNTPRRQNPQEVYDELKLRDEILSGSYANAVMIGHGPFEFSFDFITNFYPQSAVSSRVYMASGHVGRLLDSLKASWEQIRGRYGYPPPRS
ncbi:MAG: DUF3467 domain-containing protein [Planctomycetes bacterium]|nr:DUF3467 domain-containing protein [Planctomycetota bacterium]